MVYTDKEKEKLAREFYWLFREYNGSISNVSGFLGKNDSTEFSRQINPDDHRRRNPFIQTLEVLGALTKFAPDLEEAVWKILERERHRHRQGLPTSRKNVAEHLNKVFDELKDVVFANNSGASQDDLEREAFELVQAVQDQYEEIKNLRSGREVAEAKK